MELHRVQGESDWAHIPPEQWNLWQRCAARTKGWGTIGNAATVAGSGMVFAGLAEAVQHNWVLSTALIAGGRAMDVADGWLANKTGTKCVQGQALDAGFDKLQLLTALGLLTAINLTPWEMSAPIVTEQAAIAAVSFAGRQRGLNMQPGKAGKLTMAFGSGAIMLDVGSRAAEVFGAAQADAATVAQSAVEYSAYGVAGMSVAAGAVALGSYIKQVRVGAETAQVPAV